MDDKEIIVYDKYELDEWAFSTPGLKVIWEDKDFIDLKSIRRSSKLEEESVLIDIRKIDELIETLKKIKIEYEKGDE